MYIHTYSHYHIKPRPEDFIVSIISRHPEHDGQAFRQYNVEGLNTIGVLDKEPFELHFENKSNEDVSATISLDGIDVLSGKEADLEPNDSKWLVRAHSTLHLKAYHETNAGGARFVFTGADKSVALAVSGNVSHKGIIAIAVFTEGDRTKRDWLYGDDFLMQISDARPATKSSGRRKQILEEKTSGKMKGLAKEAGIAAGEYVAQKTQTVEGLRKPELHSISRIRYVWFDDLVEMVRAETKIDPFATGFPGAKKIKSFADLSMAPRVESSAAKDKHIKDGIARLE